MHQASAEGFKSRADAHRFATGPEGRTRMFKLLFSTAMVAPVLLFAASGLLESNEGLVHSSPRTAVLAAGDLPDALGAPSVAASCGSETVPLVFREGLLEMHSAEALRTAFLDDSCGIDHVRLTSLVPEDADEVDVAGAHARRAEVAATIAALIGSERAASLEMRTDLQSVRSGARGRGHALLQIRRTRTDAPADTPAPVAVAEASTLSLN